MTNFGKTVRKRLIDLDKTQDWLAAQVRGMGIPCNKTYLSKILNGARKGKQVKAAGKAETCNAITVLTALLHELRQF